MSQLCLTGLRAELCGLMLKEGGCFPLPLSPQTHTHTLTLLHSGREGGAARRRFGHGVLGNMSASFDMVQPHMKISLCYQQHASSRKATLLA